jgi:Ran GTPase-activating protein (RanGAP) involved in mRNA processing and transport
MELALLLKVNSNIAHLNMAANCLKDDNIGILCRAVEWNHTIVHLDLQENSLSGRGCTKVFKSLIANDSVCSLNIGNFANSFKNRIGDEGAEKLAQLLKVTKILSLLDLRNMVLNDANLIGLSEGLRFNTSLTYLNLSKN